ncbi:MAG: Tim44 domain-containing protein [Legionellales bacterium]
MRNFIICLCITLLSFVLVINEASAKRFGGGRSFGVQRSQSSLFKQSTPQSTSALGQKASTSKWGGFLGGALLGGLLATLFMGHGFGTGLITWLLLGAALFFLINFFKKRMQPGMQSAQSGSFGQSSAFTNPFTNSGGDTAETYPPGFDPEAFLRSAKITFIRLQAAYDQKNTDDLSRFTAPEVFGEIKMQLDERGDAPNTTEVLNLDAQLLDVSKQSLSLMASVRFTGTIKENNDPVTHFNEIWHFRQFANNNEWVVGGIQQED